MDTTIDRPKRGSRAWCRTTPMAIQAASYRRHEWQGYWPDTPEDAALRAEVARQERIHSARVAARGRETETFLGRVTREAWEAAEEVADELRARLPGHVRIVVKSSDRTAIAYLGGDLAVVDVAEHRSPDTIRRQLRASMAEIPAMLEYAHGGPIGSRPIDSVQSILSR